MTRWLLPFALVVGGCVDRALELPGDAGAPADLAGADLSRGPADLAHTLDHTPVWTLESYSGPGLSTVWSSGGQAWAAGGADGPILVHTRGGGSWDKLSVGGAKVLRSLTGSSPGDVYLGGDTGIYHATDGVTFTGQYIGNILGVFSVGAANILATGRLSGADGGAAALFLGSTGDGSWLDRTFELNGQALGGLFGETVWSDGNVFYLLGGDTSATASQVIYGDKFGWEADPVPGTNLTAVWGSSANDVYVVDANGEIFHSTGDRKWTLQQSSQVWSFLGVGGAGPNELYAVGVLSTTVVGGANEGMLVARSTGDGVWREEPMPHVGHHMTLAAVWANAPDDVWAVGGYDKRGVILHKK